MKPAAHENRLSPAALTAIALVALAAGAAWIRRAILLPDAAVFHFDSAEYALAGRAWLETGRLVTPFVHPAALGVAPGPPFPLLAGHPLVPALDALAFLFAGPTPLATLAPPLIAFALTAMLVARLADRLAGSRAAGLAAAAAFTLSPWAWRYTSQGMSEMPFAALLTLALVLLLETPERPRPLRLGLVLGLAHLCRPVLVPMLPALLAGLWLATPRAQRVPVLLRTLLAFAPLASLTALYKWAATGSPSTDVGNYLLLHSVTPELMISRLNRMVPPPDALAWITAHPQAYVLKVLRGFRNVMLNAGGSTGVPVALLAAGTATLALLRGDGRARGFALASGGGTLLLALLAAATVPDARMLFPLVPAGFALAAAGTVRTAEALGRGRRAPVLLALALLVASGLPHTARTWRRAPIAARLEGFRESEWRGLGEAVAPLLPAGALVASDAAPWIAWHTRHAVTLVPLTPDELARGGRLAPQAVVLTNEWLIARPGEEAWRECFERQQAPAGFTFVGHVGSGRLEAVVFTLATPR